MKFQTINGWTKEGMKSAIRAGNNGRPAKQEKMCCYLTPDGNKCPVGCFIPDGHPSQGEVTNALFLIHEFPDLASIMPLPVLGLRQMQEVHDSHTDARDVRDVLCEWIDENVEDGEEQ